MFRKKDTLFLVLASVCVAAICLLPERSTSAGDKKSEAKTVFVAPTELRAKLLALEQELSRELTNEEVRQRVEVLERELRTVRERRAFRETEATDKLMKVKGLLDEIVVGYRETQAAAKARRVLEILNPPLKEAVINFKK
jgi:hypothetical protein